MRVSVIVPVFNAEPFLARAVDSVLSQSHRDIELILVNDGSTDGSERLCEKLCLADSRVKLLTQTNSGPAAARNAGVRIASGDFVFFLDADDYIVPDALKTMLDCQERHPSAMTLSNFSKLDESGTLVRQPVSFSPHSPPFEGKEATLSKPEIDAFVRHFLKHPSNHLVSYCWARLYKLPIIRELGISANEDMRLFEDLVFNLEYLRHVDELAFVNEPLYVYVMHASHVSASMSILNGDSLLHDMGVFKSKVGGFFHRPDVASAIKNGIDREIGHALVHYAIIFFVRSCRLLNKENRPRIHSEIGKMLEGGPLADSLPCYSPSKGNSRLLPFLMRLKLTGLVMLACKYKAYKRYGRPGAPAK